MNPNMSPIDWARRPIDRYTDFAGRAPRAEYWWFSLALFVVFLVLWIIQFMVPPGGMIGGAVWLITMLLSLATLVPMLAVGVRRLHDTNRSGWWMLLLAPYAVALFLWARAMGAANPQEIQTAGLVGILGLVCVIALLVFMVLPSTPGDNRYGPNPYGETAATIPANS
jgi:uncharacterized membrane protein YhaH (DUF805 family)